MRATQRRHGDRGMHGVGALVAVTIVLAATPPVLAASTGDSISLTPAPAEIRSGGTIGLSGTLRSGGGAPLAGALVELQVDPFPYRGFVDLSHATTRADGTFVFATVRPDRNTRYRVRSAAGFSRQALVYVDAPAVLHSYDRGPGRVILTMLSYHSAYFRWIGAKTYWYVARAATGTFRLVDITRTHELRPGVTYATATIDPPAIGFVYRVCFNGDGEAGSGPPADHARCPHGDFRAPPPVRR